jgi:hypothetical protein
MVDTIGAADTRRYVVIHESQSEGAYGTESACALSVRLDGERYRYWQKGFVWRGTQGGVHESTRYLDRSEARALWEEEFASCYDESFDERVASALGR